MERVRAGSVEKNELRREEVQEFNRGRRAMAWHE
jgi:hypothetical protein